MQVIVTMLSDEVYQEGSCYFIEQAVVAEAGSGYVWSFILRTKEYCSQIVQMRCFPKLEHTD